MTDVHFTSKLDECRRLIASWSKRQLTVLGRITVVKTIILSRLNHLFISLPRPSPEFLKELEKLVFNFIWNGKPDRVARNLLVQNHDLGGLKMISAGNFIKSMHIKWFNRLMKSEAPWTHLYSSIVQAPLEHLLNFDTVYNEITISNTTYCFWKSALTALLDFRKLKCFCAEDSDILYTPIWYNNSIRVAGQPVYYKLWYRMGIQYIGHLLKEDGSFLSYTEFSEKYISVPFTTFFGTISTIKEFLQNSELANRNHLPDMKLPHCPEYLLIILNTNVQSENIIYNKLINSLHKQPKYIGKWHSETNVDDNCTTWSRIHQTCMLPMDMRHRWLQYRITHRILSTNSYLHKIGVINSPNCYFCRDQEETLKHLFFDCHVVKAFITSVIHWLEICSNRNFALNSIDFILSGHSAELPLSINLLSIIAKSYIYNVKYKEGQLNINAFIQYTKVAHDSELYILKKNMKLEEYGERWNVVQNYFAI